MGKHIDWYIVELEARLRARLPEPLCINLSDEIRQHLESAARDLGDDEIAEQTALRKFGAPGKIACRLVETHAPRSLQPLPKAPVVIAAVATLWMGAWLISGIYPIHFWAMLYGAIGFGLALFVTSFRARRPRPWAIAALGSVGVLLTVGILSLTWLDLYKAGGRGVVPRWQIDNTRAELRQHLAFWERQIPAMEEGVAAFSRREYDPAQDKFREGGRWRVASAPHGGYPVGPPIPGVAGIYGGLRWYTVATREEAYSAWHMESARNLEGLRESISLDKDNLRALDQAPSVSLAARAKDYFGQIAPFGLLWVGALIVANMLATYLGELIRWLQLRTARVVVR